MLKISVSWLLFFLSSSSRETTSIAQAFVVAPSSSNSALVPHHSNHVFNSNPPIKSKLSTRIRRDSRHFLLLLNNSNNDDDNNGDEGNWIMQRLQRADVLEIRRDAVLVACFVLSRFLVYDILTSVKVTPGWQVQDVVWLTGTFSSAVVLVTYWTIAGLLSRSFEASSTRPYGPIQVLVNVALCCPIWLATEHLLGFGPPDIGGSTLSEAIASGFLGLASFMTLSRALTADWER